MNRNIIVTVVAVILSGCVTLDQFDRGLSALVGKPLTTATDVLGYPSGERNVAGMRLVQWGRSTSGYMPITTPVQTYGTVTTPSGYGLYNATSNQTTYVPFSYQCSVTLRVNSAGTVIGYSYDGGVSGCKTYIERLNRYSKQQSK
jgi:hypothetical protein